jgi:hypothetical protein
MLHLIDWKAELARLAAENDADCRGAEVSSAGVQPARVHLALTEPSLDDQLLRMCVERELANFLNDQGE